ncbi:MAG: CBS domain-containing protein [bacterium]|nr:CBS domain-containing protein [bacterium]
MKVKEIMSTGVITIGPEDSFIDAAKLISANRISGLPVVNQNNECIGIVSEKDLLKTLFPTYGELFDVDSDTPLYEFDLENLEHKSVEVGKIKIKDIMETELIFAQPDLPILEAASMMVLYRIRRLPVTENKKLVGVVSQGDVFRAILNKHLKLV